MDISWFGLVWFGLVMILFINCLASDILWCPFHIPLIIWEMSLVFAKQVIRELVSVITIVIEEFNLFIHVENFFWRNLEVSEFSFLRKSTTRKSLIDAFGIFRNTSCLLELRRVWYQATEITLRNLFSPGVASQAIILIVVTLVSLYPVLIFQFLLVLLSLVM